MSFVLKKLARNFYKFLVLNLYIKPMSLYYLVLHKDLYYHKSYFPERKQKPILKIFGEQCLQILKYGTPNEYYFMYGFDVKTLDEQKKYLHYTPFMKRRDELNLASLHNSTCILRNKLYFGIFADAFAIPTVKNIALTFDDSLFLLQEKKYVSLNDFVQKGDCKLFCKVIDGECGNGIFVLEIRNRQLFCNNHEISIKDLEVLLKGKKYLFQDFICQHPLMNRLYDKAINSIRLVTVRDLQTGEIVILPSILRIGANGNIVDNTSQGGIAVGFNLYTGQLHKYGFYKPQFGLKTDRHPNTNIIFEDFCIPYLAKAITLAKHFHSLLHDIHSIGWDIAIGKNGPIFIEGNDNWEINGPQIGNHGLKSEFKKYFFNK